MPSPTRAAAAEPGASAPGSAAAVLRAQLDLGQRYERSGAGDKALAAYRAALAAAATAAERAEAHLRMARVHRARTDWEPAIADAREARRLAEESGDDDLAAEAMNAEVGVHQMRGDFDVGHALADEALARARDPRIRGMLLQNRGAMAARAGDRETAGRWFAESVAAFRQAGYERGLAIALNNAAAAACDAGEHARALALAQEAAATALGAQAFDVAVMALQNQGEALVGLDRLDEAESMLGGTMGHFASCGDTVRQAECLEILAGLHARRPTGLPTALRCLERAQLMAASASDRVLEARLAGRLAELRAR